MINSDVLETVTLSNGGYAQRSGNRTGAELGFLIREGSRERNVFRASVSGTSASLTAEGPLGHGKRGSWLVSGRKSYLDLIVRKLREEGLSFGFADAQAKLRYDLGAKQSAALTFITGKSRLRELPRQPDDTDLLIARQCLRDPHRFVAPEPQERRAHRRGAGRDELVPQSHSHRAEPRAGLEQPGCGAVRSGDTRFQRADAGVRCARRTGRGVSAEAAAFQAPPSPSSTTIAPTRYRYGGYLRARLDAGKRVVISPGARVDHSDPDGPNDRLTVAADRGGAAGEVDAASGRGRVSAVPRFSACRRRVCRHRTGAGTIDSCGGQRRASRESVTCALRSRCITGKTRT